MEIPPFIKWSGSKRSQAKTIVSLFPDEINNYYEPFLGGGSVAIQLLCSNVKVKHLNLSDINPELIALWKLLVDNPSYIISSYSCLWEKLNSLSGAAKNAFWLTLRDEFNSSRDPLIFFFLTRTCYNGLVRFNSKGLFNTAFHFDRPGIHPSKLKKIIDLWHSILSNADVSFCHQSYLSISTDDGDFVYLDPPYLGSNGAMYLSKFNHAEFFSWLDHLNCRYALSFDSKVSVESGFSLPKSIIRSLAIPSGISSFRRLKNSDNNSIVTESLFLNF